MAPIRVGLTRDLRDPDGRPAFGAGHVEALRAGHVEALRAGHVESLSAGQIDVDFLPAVADRLTAELVGDRQAILHYSGHRVDAEFLASCPQLRLVARLGVGYDQVDVEACTRAGVLLTITPDAITEPMAAGTVAMVLSLAYALPAKDPLVRNPVRGQDWGSRLTVLGTGLTGRAVGLVGFGRIGAAIARMLAGFGVSLQAHSPHLTAERAARHGVRASGLDDLLDSCDVVIVCCALTPQTRGLLDATRVARLRPGALLVNVARGGIVDEPAVAAALHAGRLAGAGFDVFAQEPPPADNPLLHAPNVLLAPHSVGYTGDMLDHVMGDACAAVAAFANGDVPPHVVNVEALDHPRLAALAGTGRDPS